MLAAFVLVLSTAALALAQTLDLTSTTFSDDPTEPSASVPSFSPLGITTNGLVEPSAPITETGTIVSITESPVTPSTFTTITVTLDGSGGVNEPTFPATLTTCFVVATQTSATFTEVLDPTASLPPDTQCFEIIREGGGVDEVPLLQVGSDGLTTPAGWSTASFPGDTAPTSLSSNLQSGSSSKKAGRIVGAVLGSVFGFILIGAMLLWLRRQQRNKPNGQFSRPRHWLRNRNGGWIADEKAPQHFEMRSPESPSAPRPTGTNI